MALQYHWTLDCQRVLLHEDCDIVRNGLELCPCSEEDVLEFEAILGAQAIEQARSSRTTDIPGDDLDLLVNGPHGLGSYIQRQCNDICEPKRDLLSPLCMTAPRMSGSSGKADM
jgi:hypothetical protein